MFTAAAFYNKLLGELKTSENNKVHPKNKLRALLNNKVNAVTSSQYIVLVFVWGQFLLLTYKKKTSKFNILI